MYEVKILASAHSDRIAANSPLLPNNLTAGSSIDQLSNTLEARPYKPFPGVQPSTLQKERLPTRGDRNPTQQNAIKIPRRRTKNGTPTRSNKSTISNSEPDANPRTINDRPSTEDASHNTDPAANDGHTRYRSSLKQPPCACRLADGTPALLHNPARQRIGDAPTGPRPQDPRRTPGGGDKIPRPRRGGLATACLHAAQDAYIRPTGRRGGALPERREDGTPTEGNGDITDNARGEIHRALATGSERDAEVE